MAIWPVSLDAQHVETVENLKYLTILDFQVNFPGNAEHVFKRWSWATATIFSDNSVALVLFIISQHILELVYKS